MPTSLGLVVVGWLAGWWLFGRPRGLPEPVADLRAEIDVVVPARNEAAQLPRLLAGLARQTLTPRLVVVVDDESEDGTAAVAQRGGATVVASGPRPPGWTGKAWACWVGARAGTSELLVFLDADTEPAPDLLARLVTEHRRVGGLLSVQPYHRMMLARERLAAMFNIVAVMGIGTGAPSSRRRPVGAFGPCVICTRNDYDEVGGHEAIASSVIDDVALAQAFAAAGHRVESRVGLDAIEFRMYPTGTRALIEGFTKNFASGAGSTPPFRTLAIAVWITALISAALQFAPTVTGGGLVGAALFAACAIQIHLFLRRLGNFGVATAMLYPVALVAFVVIFAWSIVRFFRGSVRWKGRQVALRTEPG